jgi:riboflavin synthase
MYLMFYNMFTGIIQSIGILKEKHEEKKHVVFEIEDALMYSQVQEGSSVAVSGVCLTVKEKKEDQKSLVFDIMPETIKKTTLQDIKIGQQVNLEPGLKIGDELGGHLVYGHVTAVAEVIKKETQDTSVLLTLTLDSASMRYIVSEGSVTINGVSLTVARVEENDFTVSLVAYTLEHTTLSNLEEGNSVNIEVDMMAKYVEKLLEPIK